MADIQLDKRYSPAEATRGSWAPIDSTTLSGLTATSRGKYAQLNYIVGSEAGALNLALSGGSVILPVSTVSINEPLSVINNTGTRLAVNVCAENLSTNTTQICSQTIAANSNVTIAFSPTVTFLEIYNKDASNELYIAYDSTLSDATVSARGIPIEAEGYYAIDRSTSNLKIVNTAATTTDVRVFGHARV